MTSTARTLLLLTILATSTSCAGGLTELPAPLSPVDAAYFMKTATDRNARIRLPQELWGPAFIRARVVGVSSDGSALSILTSENAAESIPLHEIDYVSFPYNRALVVVRNGALGVITGAAMGYLYGCAIGQCGGGGEGDTRQWTVPFGALFAVLGLMTGDPGPVYRFRTPPGA